MFETFADKLAFALKALSLSRGHLAAELGVDKSVVGRWVTGAVAPSGANLAKLTALVEKRASGFTQLDWDLDGVEFARAFGVEPRARENGDAPRFGDGPPLLLMDQIAATTRLRGGAYEGFFRSTRPYAQGPGLFMHDQMLIRRRENGLLGYDMLSGGVRVEGWALLLQNQLFSIGSEMTSGSLVFGIINGVSTLKAGRLDGLLLYCALDPSRTPTATAVVFDRVGDVSDNAAGDMMRLEAMDTVEAPDDGKDMEDELKTHLARDFGPSELAAGGDWLLRMPLFRSLSGGVGQRKWDVESPAVASGEGAPAFNPSACG
jgi:transcriptional regulator with XRE-family HTH domain